MSKGRRTKRSGWKHPMNLNRNRRRWRKRKRAPAQASRTQRAELLELETRHEMRLGWLTYPYGGAA